ncbi:hypothetical protein ACE01N_17855 [Saccharicrinis sp. FJH2]|uniref:hypothetical protein n=1 Tax=Saccharicrinis sp. FJH65 TaxID=3344659 RepID=UPI0035F3D2D9
MRIKFLFFTFCALMFVSVLNAQNSTSSPYTRYGLGLLETNTFGRGQSMGGSGIALRSNKTINPSNPAAFSAIDTLSQIFEFAFSGQLSQFKAGNLTQYNNDVNFSYLGMAFPISRNIGVSLGARPMSNVGYNYYTEEDLANIGVTKILYSGSGGVTNAFIGASAKLFKYLSLGANLEYLFGQVSHDRIETFPDNWEYSDFYSYEKLSVNALHYVLGLQCAIPINDQNKIIIGGTYEFKTSLNAKQDLLEQVNIKNPNTNSVLVTRTLESNLNKPIGMEMPEAYGVGLAYEIKNKLTVTGEYKLQNWSKSEFYNVTDTLGNKTRISAGIEYIPNFIDRNYFKRVEYRLGGFYSSNYITGLGEDLYNFGMTFGLGLPLRYEKTRFNIAFELGQMKSSGGSLISESYGKITINFSFNDYWFFRRKLE